MKCAYCEKPIRKLTRTVYVEAKRSEYHRPSGWASYVYPLDEAAWPRSKADCQKLVEEQVVSVKYGWLQSDWGEARTKTNHVREFKTWDGKSYLPSWKYFCSNVCAGRFAQQVVGELRRGRAAA